MGKTYSALEVEDEILKFWKEHDTYSKAKSMNKGHKKFYYLDGPPYTTGAIHVGHAWGRALRDSILRFKRMQGFDVWDRPGFDMHGLPIEVAVEKKLGITDKRQITSDIGLKRFITECKDFAISQMIPMIKDFERIGVWMDWNNPYQTITNDYIEGAWWALKKASEKKLLYKGLKTMTWCPRCATALAKHELEYKTITEKSVFVKFPILDKKNKLTSTYLIIWTTTPWTLPFNLAVMMHPEIDYVKIKVDDEYWIVAKALVESLLKKIDKKYEIVDEFKGSKMEGVRYRTPFWDEVPQHKTFFEDNSRAYSVLLTKKYVDLEAGSGLVHCAPGCGPEDYEVGKKYHLPAFNILDEEGEFTDKIPALTGMKAKKDDNKFIEMLRQKNLLVAVVPVEHDYPHCWRCKTPVIFRATEQWFLAVEKLKDEMIKKNKDIEWVPDWAGKKWFNSWLENLQDWCISRQRFWGIPLPIWKCPECGEIKVIGSVEELEKLSGKKITELHRPWIDDITIKCPKCGAEMHRIPDVLDVWLDSGAASWATIGFPKEKELFNKLWPADLILEGKDQIRGWFNSLMCLSFVSQGKAPYKAVYMHGFINDANGRKMSKSLHNIISPYEVIDKFGADSMRFYMISGANPGMDLNYNMEDLKEKYRNLNVLWNIHNYLLEAVDNYDIKEIREVDSFKNNLGVEEKYILSNLNRTIRDVTQKFEQYKLNETPELVESLFLDLSRKYIRLTRNKINKKPEMIVSVIYHVLFETLKILTPITPFITEKIYLSLRDKFNLDKESISFYEWPSYEETAINIELENDFTILTDILQAGLHLREKAGYGVRWPFKRLLIITEDNSVVDSVRTLSKLIKEQLNIKEIEVKEKLEMEKKIKLNFKVLGSKYKSDLPAIIAEISQVKPEIILEHIKKENSYKLKIHGKEILLTQEDIIEEEELPKNMLKLDINNASIVLETDLNEELIQEGFAREFIRRIQSIRKKMNLNKKQKVKIYIYGNKLNFVRKFKEQIIDKVGAVGIFEVSELEAQGSGFNSEKIKDSKFKIKVEVVD